MLARDLSGQRIFNPDVDFRLIWWAAALGVFLVGSPEPEGSDAYVYDLDQVEQRFRLFINTAAPDGYERVLEFLLTVLETRAVRWVASRPEARPQDPSLVRFDEYPEFMKAVREMAYFRN